MLQYHGGSLESHGGSRGGSHAGSLQYHGVSLENSWVLIFTKTVVASIKMNGTTIYSAFGLAFSGKLYSLDSNTIASLRDCTIFNI